MANCFFFSRTWASRVFRLLSIVPVLFLAACGGSSSTAPVSGLTHRAFISNQYSGDLQVVDTQDDMTSLTGETTNSSGQVVEGQPVYISVATSVTFEVQSPNYTTTAVYEPDANSIAFVTNSSESVASTAALGSSAGMAVFSPDSSTMYVPEPNLIISGSYNGGVQVVDVSTAEITATYSVPGAKYIAVSPDGNYLFVFPQNSDSLYLINLSASTITPVAIPGFARPINAFFSSDSTTAYVLNCGPECGSSGAASVMQFNIASQAITATVPVGGASVGLLNGTTLYVAGTPIPPGTSSTYDAVNVSNMTRITSTSVPIGDGFHTTMALATNQRLFIGAVTCSNNVTGCLSVVDVTSNTAEPALPPGGGAITGLLAVANRNVVYAIEGGYLHIYDSTTDALGPTQITFTGALYGIVQVDQ
jgi:hypothetical protein